MDISRRRAASDALSNSADIGPSLIETKFAAEDLDLLLDLGEDGEMVCVNQFVPAVFRRCQQVQRFFEVENDSLRRLAGRRMHDGERSERQPGGCHHGA